MAKKNRSKIWCEKCRKNTVHEARMVDDVMTQVCLKCEIKPSYDPKSELKHMNRMNFAEQMWLQYRR